MDRTVLHCDMNGFYASVELLDHPHLKNVPMAVCGSPENRHGIILAKNEIAKGFGVVTAETLWQARRKCPELQVVPPHHDKYRHYSRLINEIYLRFTDMVEPFSVDESWLDVTGSLRLFGSGRQIADTIRRTVREELGLTLSAGVSFNKIFAKMGSDYKKPDATTVITRENYRSILWPLDIESLFFVGSATAARLRGYGINTIGDLALSERSLISRLLGKQGSVIHDYANGLDDTPVLRYDRREDIKSIGNGITFRRNLSGEEDIKTAVTGLADTVATRLRKHHMKCFGVKVDIKDTRLKVISRQQQLDNPTNVTGVISAAALSIIKKSWRFREPVRMLTITAINLCHENQSRQLSLFSSEDLLEEKGEKLEKAVDVIRKKYGTDAISFGSVIGNDIGLDFKTPRGKE
ncbi:MAG TPA: DNA polymerase IV [Candidatus Copromorpha excrementigallinarum]|uniref:DNA polymerase IV n=1 Tax=Candidatus Allocopromorpha excrementigallinarum TaxID=2840742 RepID=A0A9D1I0F4_9FIRM|nr:DNA polymerase IV [Candidatus Copromorpha excrementigallinarum]